MGKDFKYIKAKSKENKQVYTIGVDLLKKYPNKWEAVNTEDLDPIDDMDYFELKANLSELGVEFKGNASKAQLQRLYREAIA